MGTIRPSTYSRCGAREDTHDEEHAARNENVADETRCDPQLGQPGIDQFNPFGHASGRTHFETMAQFDQLLGISMKLKLRGMS